jgi:hypothetical protein
LDRILVYTYIFLHTVFLLTCSKHTGPFTYNKQTGFQDLVTWRIYNKYDNVLDFQCKIDTPLKDYDDTLPNGYALKAYMSGVFNAFGTYFLTQRSVVATTDARICEKGTWFTCKNSNLCKYSAPITSGAWNYSNDANLAYFVLNPNVGGSEPIGACYPCSAAYDKAHYDTPGNVACTEDYVKKSIGLPEYGLMKATANPVEDSKYMCRSMISYTLHYKRIYCPGYMWPPVICNGGAESNEDYTGCECPAGKYKNYDTEACVSCEPGHYCIHNTKNVCPEHTFQDEYEQSTCKDCEDIYGNSLSTCYDDTLPGKCVDANGSRFKAGRICVPCSQCYNSMIKKYSSKSGSVLCYDS